MWLGEGVGFRGCSPPASFLQALPERSPRAQTHTPHWQREAAAARRDPGKSDNSRVGGKKKKKQPRNEESPLSCVGYFQRVALPFSQATAGCEVTCVGR